MGADHEEVADIVNSLGLVDKRQARYVDADRRFRSAIGIVCRALGELHVKVGVYTGNLGDIQRKRGDAAAAIASYESVA